jgi:hypothetical protein
VKEWASLHREELKADWDRAKGGGTPEPIDPLPQDEAMDFVRVTSAQVLGHYRPRLGFSDGTSRDVDPTGELRGAVFEPLSDPVFFAQVRVDDELGTVVWPNGADPDPLVLHGDFEPASRFVHR